MKKMTAKEFMDLGLLQEINRLFLHPMGLAIEVIEDKGSVSFGEIWDFRDDPEGLVFNDEIINGDTARKKAETVQKMFSSKRDFREKNLGFFIQPLYGKDE